MSITIKLQFPITDGNGNEVGEVILRRPKVKDLRQVANQSKDNQPSVELEVQMISRLTGLLPEDVDALDMADYTKIQEQAQAMMSGN
ncbi:phage tail assembly protein [Moraxella marmotae]|uniref:phage tail assembly protein n=1 Tax=Moraxella marmotae TaxID=3344520 RepID=UPI0035D464F2